MYRRLILLAVLLLPGVAYASYPYITVYRLGTAIRQGDAQTLHMLVNWSKVRQGIKEDICDMVIAPPPQQAMATLPAFGSSFVRGIATNVVEQRVTPEALVAAVATRTRLVSAVPIGADVHVRWAFFDSPTEFSVSLQAPGQAEDIRVELTLRDGMWRVTRVWLPEDMLRQTNAQT